VAGHGCEHPEIEGVFVPLSDGIGKPAVHALQQHFRGDWHPLIQRDAEIVDGILRRSDLSFITTDATKLSESREAWVWVTIRENANSPLGPGFGSCNGVLTWQNSD
jgi:hypothetical protein